MSEKYLNLADKFYNALNQKNNSIALSTMWIVFFDYPPIMGGAGSAGGYSSANQVKDIKAREVLDNVFPKGKSWDNWERGAGTVRSYIRNDGVLYASQVVVPGDNYNTQRYGDYSMGWQKGLIGAGRGQFQNLTITFYETNASITDFVLRPWSILVGHNSLKISTVKSKVHVVPLLKAAGGYNLPRKVFSFYNCWPSRVGSETYAHTPESVISRSVNFEYDYYSVTNVYPNSHNTPNNAGRSF
jgi:hypothetical protein